MQKDITKHMQRTLRALRRPGSVLKVQPSGGGVVRVANDNSSRIVAKCSATDITSMVQLGWLRKDAGGYVIGMAGENWQPVKLQTRQKLTKDIMDADGHIASHDVYEDAYISSWLRLKAQGDDTQITPQEQLAAETLFRDCHAAGFMGAGQVAWLNQPSGTYCGATDASDRRLTAKARVSNAFRAVVLHRQLLMEICVYQSSRTIAERKLGLSRRQLQKKLKQALGSLAKHYGYVDV